MNLYHLPYLCKLEPTVNSLLFHPVNYTWLSLHVINKICYYKTNIKMWGKTYLPVIFLSWKWIYVFILEVDIARTVPDISQLIFSSFQVVTLKTNSGYHLFGESKDGLLWQSLAVIKLPFCWMNIFTFCHQSFCPLRALLVISY